MIRLRAAVGVLLIVLLLSAGCQTGKRNASGPHVDRFDARRNYTYDKFGFQVDPKTGDKIDSAYNLRLEKVIGR